MEVPIPEVELGFDFSDANVLARELDQNIPGSHSFKMVRFIADETRKLRTKFTRRDIFAPINEEYIQIFNSSKDQVRNALELICWFAKLDFDKTRTQISKLEGMKKDASSKLTAFKRELVLLKLGLRFKSSVRKRLKQVLQVLAEMKKELKKACSIHVDLVSQRDKIEAEWRKMLNRINVEDNIPGITGELINLLLQWQSKCYNAHVMACWEIDKYFVLKINDFWKFVNEQYKWIDEHIHWNKKTSLLVNDNNNLDALGVEMVDVSELFNDM